MKILILWSGAVVPSYRRFFLELAKRMEVRVLSPRRWTHGSVAFGATETDTASGYLSGGPETPRCQFHPVAYLPEGGSRYWVPSLILHLWAYRPRYLYVMEELDRPSLAWHALMARLAWPPVRVVSYSLQNILVPSYYRWHHRLALRANRTLVSRAIAASREAEQVLRANGFGKPTRVIPLWASKADFHPGNPDDVASFRRGLGIKEGETAIVFAGSMVEAKGLLLLRQVLPRFRHMRVIAAGNGPLGESMARDLGRQWLYLGAQEGDALMRVYQAGDYVILPSLTLGHWKEQIGRALIEGILCGCIALGSDSGHIPELTLFPETSFRQGDAESLARMLSGLPLRNAESVRMAQHRNVEMRFTASAAAGETASFLESGT